MQLSPEGSVNWLRACALASSILVASSTALAQGPVETIGPWPLKAAPVSASLITGGGGIWHSLNIVNVAIDENTAFSGVGVADDGFANAAVNTVVEVVFAPGAVINLPGNDLVMFDALFSINSYAVSTDYDAFAFELPLPSTAFALTGVTHDYYYQGGLNPQTGVLAAPFDLSNLGVPTGAMVTRVRFRTTSGEADPLGIGALCNPGCALTVTYCTAGTSSNGCVASISSTGIPSASAGSGFTIRVANVEGLKSGISFYGISAPIASPWGTGSSFLCVKAPIQRTGLQNTGGTFAACNGALNYDWNQYIAAHPTALGNPFAAGASVYAQGWFRDPPASKSTNLSNALTFVVTP